MVIVTFGRGKSHGGSLIDGIYIYFIILAVRLEQYSLNSVTIESTINSHKK